MTKFICETQVMSITVYTGPSGKNYQSSLHRPFNVDNPEDIEYFKKNGAFKELGIIESIKPSKPVSKPSADKELSKELSKIKGLDNRNEKKIIEAYGDIDTLKAELEGGADLTLTLGLSKNQAKILKEYFIKED